MSFADEIFHKYLKHLGVQKNKPALKSLHELVTAQIIKFPFENVSKLILQNERGLIDLVDFETHLSNSIKFSLGGTCYANNYYFNQLLNFLGYNATLHGSNMQKAIDVHMVSIIELDGNKYLVDVGYGAPFYKAMNLNNDKPVIVKWGELKYELTIEDDERPKLTVYKNGECVHDYIVNPEARNIDHFTDVIIDSFRENAEFMKRLRIIRFFESYGIELKNLKYTINKQGTSKSYYLKNVDELEKIVHDEFKLPNLPVRKACEILTKIKGVDLGEERYSF